MKNLITYCILLVSIFLSVSTLKAQGNIRFVKEGGSGDGSSWSKASGDLQAMIDASTSGDEIWIAEGRYKPTRLIRENKKRSYAFHLKNGVSLLGGFAGSETSKQEREHTQAPVPLQFLFKHRTIIDGNIDDNEESWQRVIEEGSTSRYIWKISGHEKNANHLLYLPDIATHAIVIDGLVLTGAYADVFQVKVSGAALYARGEIHLLNSIIKRNATYSRAEGNVNFFGGAVYIGNGGGKARIENCLFEDNQAYLPTFSAEGGAVYLEQGTISNSLFRANVGVDAGGAVRLNSGEIKNCYFYDCYGGKGGAICANDAQIKACYIADCRGLVGGGIYSANSQIHHTQILGCYADDPAFGEAGGGSGGGIYGERATTVIGSLIANCSSGKPGGGVGFKTSGKLYHSTVQQCNARLINQPVQNVTLGEGGIMLNTIASDDPSPVGFIRSTSFTGSALTPEQKEEIYSADWALDVGSDHIATGEIIPETPEPTDMRGVERIRDGKIDRGAFAYKPPQAIPAIVVTMSTENSNVKLGVGGNEGTSFSIDFGSGQPIQYEGAKVITETVQGRTIKIYGEGILVFVANQQGIASLDLSNAKSLMKLQVMDNELKSLDVSHSPNLYMLYCDRNKISGALNLKAQNRMNVISCQNNQISGRLDLSHIENLTSIICNDNRISELILPSKADKLTTISCENNEIEQLNVTQCSELDELLCANNKIKSLDLTKNHKLTKLYAVENALSWLDLSQNKQLKTLTLTKNSIETINLSHNTAIENLYLGQNKLKQIDLTPLKALQWLILDDNHLEKIDLSQQSKLKQIKASHNKLHSIDLSHNPELSVLWVGNNQLKQLDISRQKQLIWLECDSNRLTHLSIENNKNIVWLECQNNEIASLEVAHLSNLQKLFASHNKLKEINLKSNQGIQGIRLDHNELHKEVLTRLLNDLPDVSSVEINENNKEWVKQIDISYNYGSSEVDTNKAHSLGWIVKNAPGLPDAITPINAEELHYYYDKTNQRLHFVKPYLHIEVYNMLGQKVLFSENPTEWIDLSSLDEGTYIAVAYYEEEVRQALRLIR